MDLISYVLFSRDDCFVTDMVSAAALEAAEQYHCEELKHLVETRRQHPQLYCVLFFLLLNQYTPFRHWVLTTREHGLPPICEHKAVRFLHALRKELAPGFLVDEVMEAQTFLRNVKIEYVRS